MLQCAFRERFGVSPQTRFQTMKLNAVHRSCDRRHPFGERTSDTLKRREHLSRRSRLRRSMRSECLRFSDRRTASVALCSFSFLRQEGRPWDVRLVIGTATAAAAKENSTCVCGWLWWGHRASSSLPLQGGRYSPLSHETFPRCRVDSPPRGLVAPSFWRRSFSLNDRRHSSSQ
jgi:hypothetical protein